MTKEMIDDWSFLLDYLERKYEQVSHEPWSALEERVRARHPEFFAMCDAMESEPEEPKLEKKWWQIWKAQPNAT